MTGPSDDFEGAQFPPLSKFAAHRRCVRCGCWVLLDVGEGRHCGMCRSVKGIREPLVGGPRRRWKRRPDKRWGWESDDGHELEWRRAEGDCGSGYYLFGPGVLGLNCGTGKPDEVLSCAEQDIREAALSGRPEEGDQ